MDNRIENLSLKDLVELHDRIARRIWELEKGKLSEKLGEFQIGDRVNFQSEGKTVSGTVIRVNRKTLSVRSQEGYWYVAPWAVTKTS
ncbi:MAG: hypothetical protein COZ37_03445 [bacterium (Candidatus Ratteibacteria) CG_4_10_14_3_um_filter_41_18]|uniref:Mechanosensitive ion channel MscS domain-containing protein n=2 Tax=Candidatus Ratteibacteria TaxID=2979319 RepID=A0A2M7E8V9_9BACT|nr:MAG: hypothetical protein COS11_03695 [bacterium (Candidatus Ratteibacteria) CG01_land_8_20_14_3_00_40_19]PIX77288.1 MAG: hypothetical protein COZ37_03445 [bacterium (Candidatus Ratteibacteria) CG_4_10_14_3_um_filter_41_18]